MSAQTELFPCPFCGSHYVSFSQGRYNDNRPFQYVECEACEATSGSFETNQLAVASWNKRAAPSVSVAPESKKTPSIENTILAGHIVDAILRDLRDRNGIGDSFDECEAEIQDEIRATLVEVTEKVLLSEQGDGSSARRVSSEASPKALEEQEPQPESGAEVPQMALQEIRSSLKRIQDEKNSIQKPYDSVMIEAMRILSLSMFTDIETPLLRAEELLAQSVPELPKSDSAPRVSSTSLPSPSSFGAAQAEGAGEDLKIRGRI